MRLRGGRGRLDENRSFMFSYVRCWMIGGVTGVYFLLEDLGYARMALTGLVAMIVYISCKGIMMN